MNDLMIKKFTFGMMHIIAGLRIILKSPKLMAFAAIPFLIDLLLLFIGFSWGWGEIPGWAESIVTKVVSPESWLYTILYYPLWLVFAATFVLMMVYSVFLVATVVAAPFNSLLAEETLRHLGRIDDQSFSMGRWIRVSTKMMMVALIKAMIFAVIGLVLFVMSFIPGVNLVAAFIACMIIAFDNIDYSLELFEWNLNQRFQFYRTNIIEFSGAAAFIALTVLLPGLTLLLLPAAVVGSAEMAGRLKGGLEDNEGSRSQELSSTQGQS